MLINNMLISGNENIALD